MKILSILMVISGFTVFAIAAFEHVMIGNDILDVIAHIQYPFNLIFVTLFLVAIYYSM